MERTCDIFGADLFFAATQLRPGDRRQEIGAIAMWTPNSFTRRGRQPELTAPERSCRWGAWARAEADVVFVRVRFLFEIVQN